MSAKDTLVGLALSLFVVGAPSAFAQQDPTGSWASEQSGANFRQGASASDGTFVYFCAGYQYGVTTTNPDYYQQCRRYDPVNNSWSTLAVMPLPLQYSAGAYYGGRIFVFGGYNRSTFEYSSAIWAYSVSTNSWATLSTAMSSPRYGPAAATLGDRIYVTGGYNYDYLNTMDEFNPGNDTITSRANMPGGSYFHGMAAYPTNNKVYVLGGYNNNGYSSVCYEYSPPDSDSSTTNDNTWATKAPIFNGTTAQQRYAPLAMTLGTRIYVIGGYGNNGNQSTTLEYNPGTDLWVQRASMANQRYFLGGGVVDNKGYAYGGYSSLTTCEEYTPPEFGSPPHAPTGVTQSGSRAETALQALPDPSQYNGWTNNQVSFSAHVIDPDAGQLVRLRIRVRAVGTTAWTNLDSGLLDQGLLTLPWTIPANGQYDWMYRAEDSYGNSYPSSLINAANDAGWIQAYSNDYSPDFRSDQISPADPVALSPAKTDIQVPDPVTGNVTLTWIESTDNGPVAGISYELQVARDGGFIDVEAQLFSSAGTDSYPVALSVSRYEKYWRIRARDVGGNLSNWSPPLTFRVTYNDGLNHSAGDASKTCGMSAMGGPGLASALLGVALLGLAAGRRILRR